MKNTYSEPVEAMKAGMRRLASGVTVITTLDDEGNRHAMTATSVTSLSDSPASLLICVNKSSSLFPVLKAGAKFCVNVLSAGMDDISGHCAGKEKGEGRFTLGQWEAHEEYKLPYLKDAQAAFFCENDKIDEYGTHLICIGKIVEVKTASDTLEPLVFLNGKYHSLA